MTKPIVGSGVTPPRLSEEGLSARLNDLEYLKDLQKKLAHNERTLCGMLAKVFQSFIRKFKSNYVRDIDLTSSYQKREIQEQTKKATLEFLKDSGGVSLDTDKVSDTSAKLIWAIVHDRRYEKSSSNDKVLSHVMESIKLGVEEANKEYSKYRKQQEEQLKRDASFASQLNELERIELRNSTGCTLGFDDNFAGIGSSITNENVEGEPMPTSLEGESDQEEEVGETQTEGETFHLENEQLGTSKEDDSYFNFSKDFISGNTSLLDDDVDEISSNYENSEKNEVEDSESDVVTLDFKANHGQNLDNDDDESSISLLDWGGETPEGVQEDEEKAERYRTTTFEEKNFEYERSNEIEKSNEESDKDDEVVTNRGVAGEVSEFKFNLGEYTAVENIQLEEMINEMASEQENSQDGGNTPR